MRRLRAHCSARTMAVSPLVPAFRPCWLLCVVLLAACWHGALITGGSGTGAAAGTQAEKANIKLKIGALFDVRARHLVGAFQRSVDDHNNEEAHAHRGVAGSEEVDSLRTPSARDSVGIIFEPVITFVDVTDSFAVSNAMCDLIAHDVIAIVGITNASSLPTIQSYSATFHVPFLSLGSSQNVTSAAPFQLSLRPPVMAAVVDLLHHQGCSSALYMYDSDEGLMRIQDLFQAINIRELYLELDVRRIGDRAHVTEISKIIGSLHPRREICLILDVERLDARSIVSVVQGSAPTVKDIILVTLDAGMALNKFLQDPEDHPRGFNISGLQLVPTLRPSSWLHFHPHRLHPSPSVHRWAPSLSSKEEHVDHHRVLAHMEGGLERSPHGNVKTVYQKQVVHSNEDSAGDSNREHQSRQSVEDAEYKLYRSVVDSDHGTKPEQDHRSGFDPDTREFTHQSHQPPDPADSDSDGLHSPHLHRAVFDEIGTNEPASFKAHPGHSETASGGGFGASSSTHPVVRSCEALIVDCLKVLTAALGDLWDTLGDVLGSPNEESPEDMSIKCTNFVVEKKQYGADLMEALRLVHIQGETRYISFDTGGKREDYTLSVLSLPAGATVVRNEGEWSSVTGLTSDAWSRDGVRSYTIFGNISGPGRRIILGVRE